MKIDIGPVGRVLPYMKGRWLIYTLAIGVLFLGRAAEGLVFQKFQIAIDTVADVLDTGLSLDEMMLIARPELSYLAWFVVVVTVFRLGMLRWSRAKMMVIGLDIGYELRQRMYGHLQTMGPRFYANFSTGDLMARAINDISLVRNLISGNMRMIAATFGQFLVGFGFMMEASPFLTLVVLPPLPIMSWLAFHYSKTIYARSLSVQEGFADLSEYVQENLNGIRTIQALAQEEAEVKRFSKLNTQYADAYIRMIRLQSLLGAYMPGIGDLCRLIVFVVGGWLVIEGEMTFGVFAVFFLYLNMVMWPVRAFGNIISQWQRGASGSQRLFEIFDFEPEIVDLAPKGKAVHLKGGIDVNHLSYTYPGATVEAISDISMHVEPGETVAILGRVGSGKSTVLKLLARLLDPPADTIHYDGQDIRSLPLSDVRGQVALVLQEPFLFADTVASNITYDEPTREKPVIWDAAEAASIKETIELLPDQLDTEVGERGVTLSGGQKQRSTLARGLIRTAPVLLLDDCFSSVDTETEEHILTNLRRLRANKTTVMVSHRVSTARHADRIYIIEDGKILETGSHEELLKAGGFYAKLEQAQRNPREASGLANRTSGGGDAA